MAWQRGHSRFMAAWLGLGCACGALAQTQASAPAPAPTPGFVSRPVLVSPITGVEGKELVVVAVSLAPGASSPPHTHPGDCYGSLVEGAIELRIQGRPAQRFAAGDSYANLGGLPHQFTNLGATPVRMINSLVVEKGKPRTVALAEPVK